ncbi:MAG: DNA-binding protein WhiA [Bifidobacteriaceae bacterium]|jgi:DNA-binding protein WhiA|nr:DNA-binding protein WhiA [Bifidobacteriaceae bacterium]
MNWTKSAIDEIASVKTADSSVKEAIVSVAMRLNGELKTDGTNLIINIHTRSIEFAKRLSSYIKSCFDKNTTIINLKGSKLDDNLPHLIVQNISDDNSLIVKAGLTDKAGMPVIGFSPDVIGSDKQLIKYAIGSAFISTGRITDPSNAGIIEFIVPNSDLAIALSGLLGKLNIDSKTKVPRGVNKVIVKEKYDIADLLSFIGAVNTSDQFLKDYKKTIKAHEGVSIKKNADTNSLRSYYASKIAIIRAKRALEILGGEQIKEELIDAAKTRIANPDASLEKLGTLCSPPISKDAIASRLRRLNILADKIAQKKGIPDTSSGVENI